MTALLCLWSLLACAASPPASTEAPPVVRAPPPAAKAPPTPTITAVDGAGLRAHMTAPAEHVRVYSFWASWCGPCLAEFPILKTFAARHQDVDLFLVNVDHTSVQAARLSHLVAAHGLQTLPHLALTSSDPNRDLRAAVDAWPEQIPTAIVVAPDGTRVGMLAEQVQGAALEALVRSSP